MRDLLLIQTNAKRSLVTQSPPYDFLDLYGLFFSLDYGSRLHSAQACTAKGSAAHHNRYNRRALEIKASPLRIS